MPGDVPLWGVLSSLKVSASWCFVSWELAGTQKVDKGLRVSYTRGGVQRAAGEGRSCADTQGSLPLDPSSCRGVGGPGHYSPASAPACCRLIVPVQGPSQAPLQTPHAAPEGAPISL